MTRQFLLPLLLVAPLTATAQTTTSSGGVRKVHALGSSVTFSVPTAWHVLVERDTGTLAQFVYHVRDPATDTIGSARTNVIINIRRRPGPHTFQAFTDSMLGGLIDPSMDVLTDSTAGPNQRALFWRGQEESTVYVGFDDFARAGDTWVHIRIALPLTPHATPDWSDTLSAQTRALLRSVRFGTTSGFPVDLGYPVLAKYGPGQ